MASLGPARAVLASPEVAGRWESPSALAEMTVGALAGHLLRAATTLHASLASTPGGGSSFDAAGYFLSIEGLAGPGGIDLGSPLHAGIRQRAMSEGAGGAGDVLARWDETASRLADALRSESPERVVAAREGRPMTLGEYTVTRLVELVVHTDDLAASVGVDAPPFPSDAYDLVVGCLVEMAVRRHGPGAVVRALTRRERDTVEALRVL